MQPWQLPEYIADVLPSTARQLETAKESLLALFRVHGFELVNPPLIEYTQSLMTKLHPGLSLKTIRVIDQLSGLQLGLRADITPQITRIDAHLLSEKNGVNRLCYAGPTLHARPDSLISTREPLQSGAEIYGYSGIEADIELIDLMLKSLDLLGVKKAKLSLGHVAIFRTLAKASSLSVDDEIELLNLLQSKDVSAIEQFCISLGLNAQYISTFTQLASLYGGFDIIEKARTSLPQLEGIQAALHDIETIYQRFNQVCDIHLDFAELRVDNYHTGLLFSAYKAGWSDALARGGRYDNLGAYFGRARPATGFSFDLKDFLEVLPESHHRMGIHIDKQYVKEAKELIDNLRQAGEVVIIDYLGEGAQVLHCNRQIIKQNDAWTVENCA